MIISTELITFINYVKIIYDDGAYSKKQNKFTFHF